MSSAIYYWAMMEEKNMHRSRGQRNRIFPSSRVVCSTPCKLQVHYSVWCSYTFVLYSFYQVGQLIQRLTRPFLSNIEHLFLVLPFDLSKFREFKSSASLLNSYSGFVYLGISHQLFGLQQFLLSTEYLSEFLC